MTNLEVTYDQRLSLGLLVGSTPETPYHRKKPRQSYETYYHQAPRHEVALGITDS